MLKNVKKDWVSKIDDKLEDIMNEIAGQNIVPAKENILEAFKLTSYKDVKVVILGQDPYYTPDTAHGLAFSINPLQERFPPSLKTIFNALINCGLMKEMPCHGCLSNWAAQGVLLLNAALTTVEGTANAHKSIWKEFTNDIMITLAEREKPIVFMLWGGFARKKAKIIKKYSNGQHLILERAHPSPLANNRLDKNDKFERCNDFVRANKFLHTTKQRQIVWDTMIPTVIYTDGCCLGNNFPAHEIHRRRAGWGVVFKKGPLPNYVRFGRMKPETLSGEEYKPTNNRAELWAIMEAMNIYVSSGCVGDFNLYTDSKICAGTLNGWLSRWENKGEILEHANPDLLCETWRIYKQLKRVQGREFVMRFHHIPRTKNTTADKYANRGARLEDYIPRKRFGRISFS